MQRSTTTGRRYSSKQAEEALQSTENALAVSGGRALGAGARKRELPAMSGRERYKQPSRSSSRCRRYASKRARLREPAGVRASDRHARKDRDHPRTEKYGEKTGAEPCPSFAPLAGAP